MASNTFQDGQQQPWLKPIQKWGVYRNLTFTTQFIWSDVLYKHDWEYGWPLGPFFENKIEVRIEVNHLKALRRSRMTTDQSWIWDEEGSKSIAGPSPPFEPKPLWSSAVLKLKWIYFDHHKEFLKSLSYPEKFAV